MPVKITRRSVSAIAFSGLGLGAQLKPGPAQQGFRDFLVEDLQRWRSFIAAARITADGG